MAQKKASKNNAKREQPTKRQGNLSLHPLEFEEAVAVFLTVPPPPKPAKTKAKPQTTKH